nr:3-methyl-2-oxobutanoate hydroxymethyltransferase [uncultured Limnohabitans sp.]
MNPSTTVPATPYGTLPPASPLHQRRPISLPRLQQLREAGEKITMLTAYDATFAAVADAAGVECLLVGDSLGMVCQGLPSTVGVTLETMRYHTESVFRGLNRVQATAWLIADLPYGSYTESREQALRSSCVLMQAGAHMVKLEGGGWTAPTVQFLVERGIPICAHLGLTPQTVHALGGYRVQGTTDEAARTLKQHANELQDAGNVKAAIEAYVSAVKQGRFPDDAVHAW